MTQKAYQLIIALVLSTFMAQAQATALPETNIYLVSITKTRTGFQFGKPKLVGSDKGYNNQPFFTSDGTAILYSSNAGSGNTDIFRYNIAKRKSTRVTNTKLESEYSPRPTPAGDRISCVRVEKDTVTQSFVSYDLKGKKPINELPQLKTMGYYTWLGGSDLYTFMLPEPFSLVHYRTAPFKQETLANNIGRCIVNFRNKIFYVDKVDTTNYKLRAVSKENMRMVKNKVLNDNPVIVEMLEGEEDFAMANDGTFYMGKDGKLYSYNLRKNKGQTKESWTEVIGFDELGLGKFYRLVFSPDNTMLAVVVYKEKKP
ncbi:MAG: hypothetical protein RL660_255 [Bacteroidota bacterium]|jgi:hypothetical protein